MFIPTYITVYILCIHTSRHGILHKPSVSIKFWPKSFHKSSVIFDILRIKILNYSFCIMESLHCNFHDVENSNCTYHIVDNITRCFPHSGNLPRWALKGPFGGHECPRGCPGLYYYRTKISKKVLPIVENVLWKKDVHRSCKKWENYKVQL